MRAMRPTLVQEVARGWEKLRLIFIRVRDALLSFVLINFAARVIRGFFTSIIESNAQLEILDIRLRQIMKGDGGIASLRQAIIDLTVFTPFIIRDLVQATVSLKAFGLNAKRYLQPVADWAVAIGRNIEDMSVAFAKIAAGSPRTALLLTTRGIRADEFKREAAKVQDKALALANIIERRYGEMARAVARSFEGFVSNIKDAWFLLAQVIGQPIFEELRRDVERIFSFLRSITPEEGEGATGVVAVLADSLRVMYQGIKLLLPVIGGLVIALGIRGLAGALVFLSTQLKASFVALNAMSISMQRFKVETLKGATGIAGLGAGIKAFTGAITVLGTLITAGALLWLDYKSRLDKAAESQKAVNKNFAQFGPESVQYRLALEGNIEALKDLNTNLALFEETLANLSKRMTESTVFMNLLRAGLAVLGLGFVEVKKAMEDAQASQLERSRDIKYQEARVKIIKEVTQALIDQANAQKELADASEALGLRKTILTKESGQAVLEDFFNRQKAEVERLRRAQEAVPFFAGLPLEGAFKQSVAEQLARAETGLELLRKLLIPEQELRREIVAKALEAIPNAIKRITVGGQGAMEVIKGIVELLPTMGKESAKAATEIRKLQDELNFLEAQFKSLLRGEAGVPIAIKIDANLAKLFGPGGLLEQQKEIQIRLQDPKDLQAPLDIIKNEQDVLRTTNDTLTQRLRLTEKLSSLEDSIAEKRQRQLELTRDLEIERIKLEADSLEFQSRRLGDISLLYEARNKQLEALRTQEINNIIDVGEAHRKISEIRLEQRVVEIKIGAIDRTEIARRTAEIQAEFEELGRPITFEAARDIASTRLNELKIALLKLQGKEIDQNTILRQLDRQRVDIGREMLAVEEELNWRTSTMI
jgi:hypothetical protein